MSYEFDLPPVLEKFRAEFLKTERPAIRLNLKKTISASPEKSKIGGIPFWPAGADLPKNSAGENLFFLAQINFSEMPTLENFPEKGLLQFWISNDDGYGLDFDNPENQSDFRVVFFENFEQNGSLDFSFLKETDEMPVPAGTTFLIDYQQVTELCPTTDYYFWQKFGDNFFEQFGKNEWEIREELEEILLAPGHKIGGYAHFTQEDPRSAADPMVLLFQLDTDADSGISWGDEGVANFFIRPADLAKLDFSRVLFNWDCY
jgi:uncharacterized protein YwqG